MNIVKIHYGLGNQLFQFAFARAMNLRHNVEIKLDSTFYEQNKFEDHPRLFLLDKFKIPFEQVDSTELEKYFNKSIGKRMISRIQKLFGNFRSCIIYEYNLQFNKRYIKKNEDCYWIGYWQDFRYFKEFNNIIKEDLNFIFGPFEENKSWIDKINFTNSVCIHVRRGDYLTEINNTVILTSLKYYNEAIEIICLKVKDPVFYIFSDDYEWSKDNIKIECDHYFLNHNGEHNAHEDLRLMKTCKHHIISNSSFSWWGAWLGSNPEQIVVCPKKWRINDVQMFQPENWIQL
jgi:hypothetical protein